MKYQLTVICPGIRTENWVRLYNSIQEAFHGSWEIIFISPFGLPKDLQGKENIQWISDFGTPIRCQQIGLVNALGEWITWAADDGYYLPNSLDIGFVKLAENNMDYKTLIMGKYIEGDNNGDMSMTGNAYYVLSNHDASFARYLPRHYFMLNVGIVSRKLLYEVGGWDCQFEVCPMSYNDLAIRLQNYGVRFVVQDEIMFKCSHMPGTLGDHGPVHNAQTKHDEPLFRSIYSEPDCINRIKIDLNNWENSPKRWVRRFGYV